MYKSNSSLSPYSCKNFCSGERINPNFPLSFYQKARSLKKLFGIIEKNIEPYAVMQVPSNNINSLKRKASRLPKLINSSNVGTNKRKSYNTSFENIPQHARIAQSRKSILSPIIDKQNFCSLKSKKITFRSQATTRFRKEKLLNEKNNPILSPYLKKEVFKLVKDTESISGWEYKL